MSRNVIELKFAAVIHSSINRHILSVLIVLIFDCFGVTSIYYLELLNLGLTFREINYAESYMLKFNMGIVIGPDTIAICPYKVAETFFFLLKNVLPTKSCLCYSAWGANKI